MSQNVPWVCGICMRGLSQLDGQWVHVQVPDHLPHPIPLAEALEVDYRCDFCSGSDVAWVYYTQEYVRNDSVVHEYGELGKPEAVTPRTSVRHREVTDSSQLQSQLGEKWAACTECAKLVDGLELGYLVRRVKRIEPRVQTSFLKAHFKELFRTIKGKSEFQPPSATDMSDQ